MSDTNYEDILNTSWDDIPEVALLPDGSYLLKGRSATFQPPKNADQSPVALFVYNVKEPMDDVPEDELAKLGADYDFGSNRIFTRFYLESKADYDTVRKHLAKHGVETQGRSIAESFKDFKGTEVIAFVKQDTFVPKDGGDPRTSNVASTFAKLEG